MTSVFLTLPPWKPGIGLNLDSTSMRVTPGPQFSQFKMFIFYFSGNYFGTRLNCHISSVDLIPKLRARPEYQLSCGIIYINVKQCDLHRHYLDRDTNHSNLNNPSGPQSYTVKCEFITWIWSPFCLLISSHMLRCWSISKSFGGRK